MKRLILATLVVSLASPTAASADDLIPPAWRGEPGSTYQAWTFDTEPTSGILYPEVDDNEFGSPAILDSYWPDDSDWLALHDGRPGVWNPYWEFYVELPNDDAALPLKDIYIQITWNEYDEEGANVGRPAPSVYWPSGEYTNSVELDVEYPLESNWMYSRWHVRIWPNPDSESIEVISDNGWNELVIDQIVVDTICIPEPATLVLLGLGGLAVLRRG
ncbi:MAG: PEP-CTERM sorting domain-containing protein [Phycisphaerae bacterium]|nr:PEP-CTERM sorting domain-containing protein [Phycisphaerae bacterium]